MFFSETGTTNTFCLHLTLENIFADLTGFGLQNLGTNYLLDRVCAAMILLSGMLWTTFWFLNYRVDAENFTLFCYLEDVTQCSPMGNL